MCVLFSPVLLCGILLLLRFPRLVSQALLGSDTHSSRLFLSFSCSFSLTFSLSLLFSLSLCFLDFFLDLVFKEEELLSRGASRIVCLGEDVWGSEGGWLNLSGTADSWESQSRPLLLESLLTSDNASKGRGMSSMGSCWELDGVPPSGAEPTTPDGVLPASPLPLEELILPLTGGVAALLARCDILGFLLASGSMKSAAGRFWRKQKF